MLNGLLKLNLDNVKLVNLKKEIKKLCNGNDLLTNLVTTNLVHKETPKFNKSGFQWKCNLPVIA